MSRVSEGVEVPTIDGKRAVIRSHIILCKPIRAIAGRSYSVGCTLCRQTGESSGLPVTPATGQVGFFRSLELAESASRRHSDFHLEVHKQTVHVVILPQPAVNRGRRRNNASR